MEKMKQSKKRQVLFGLLSGVTTWISGFLLSGFVIIGSTFSNIIYLREIISFPGILFPFLLVFLCIKLALMSSKNKLKHFFIAFEIVLLIPILSLIPGVIFAILSDKWLRPPFLDLLAIIFNMISMPFVSTVVIGIEPAIAAIFGNSNGVLEVLNIGLMTVAGLAPITGMIVYWKKSKRVKDSSENIAGAEG